MLEGVSLVFYSGAGQSMWAELTEADFWKLPTFSPAQSGWEKWTKRSGFQNILSKGSVTHRLKYTCCLVTPWANYLFDTEGMTDSEHTWTAWSTRLAEVLGTHTMKLYLYLCQRTPLGQDPPTLLGTVQENGRDTLLQTHRSPCLVLEVSSMQSNAGFSFLKPSKPHAKHFCFYWTLH